jgi:aspartyl-tRNA(Asn)/glutamyl-tRNA(Gln) amidotransferase subunit C
VKITEETVLALGQLARLHLEPGEVERMRRDLEAILDYVEQLAELDTSEVPPTSHVLDVATPMRSDRVAEVLPVDAAVQNAPRHDHASMIVPKVLE